MEWLTSIKSAIEYMEDNMTDSITPGMVADHVNMSTLYLQRGFQIITGYTLGEYMRNRKLYLAAVELKHSDTSVLDIALKYGYENQSSFDKAFSRFHGATPREVQKSGEIKTFLPMTINIQVNGGVSMNFKIEKKDVIKVVGFKRQFAAEDSYTTVPKFWDEMMAKYCSHICKGQAPEGDMETFIASHHVGEFGICLNGDTNTGAFDYLIAGYDMDSNENIPEEMFREIIPESTWAVFDCTMKTLQETNTKIWSEWLPGNTGYTVTGNYDIEWYDPQSPAGPDMHCQIWIPVKNA